MRNDSPELEHKKRCLYRQWWPLRSKITQLNKRITHSEKFAQMYGETLEQYHARLKAETKPEFKATMDFYKKAGR